MEYIDQNGCVGFFPRQSSAENSSTSQEAAGIDAGGGVFTITKDDNYIHFSNCYYNEGGTLKLAEGSSIPLDELSGGSIAAFRMSTGKVIIYRTMAELQSDQKKADEYVIALYVLAEDGSVVVDLRSAPHVQYWEEDLV
jgi:hypothetical protein